MTGKSDKLFHKMNGIKKNVAYDRSKKITKTSNPIKEELEDKLDENQVLRNKIIELELELVSKSEKILVLESAINRTKSELNLYKRDSNNIVNVCREGFIFYAAGRHFEESTFRTKILDRGEKAQEILDLINKKGEKLT